MRRRRAPLWGRLPRGSRPRDLCRMSAAWQPPPRSLPNVGRMAAAPRSLPNARPIISFPPFWQGRRGASESFRAPRGQSRAKSPRLRAAHLSRRARPVLPDRAAGIRMRAVPGGRSALWPFGKAQAAERSSHPRLPAPPFLPFRGEGRRARPKARICRIVP